MMKPRRATPVSAHTIETTRDGRAIEIRPLEASDKPLLAEGLKRMSEESRYRRFLSPKHEFTSGELSYLTEVDHHDHEALIALDCVSGEAVGVARYVRRPDERGVAEPAVAVIDDWQGAGVGKALLGLLIDRATEEGISSFRALVQRDNRPMLKLLDGEVSPTAVDAGPGLVEVEFELQREPRGAREKLLSALRAAARGQLTFRLR
jgi:GNAT superfamily N-acetyltransferase